MLNIGKLRADAVNYYVGAVAPTTADYYFGRGESPGRWTGSLAAELGLAGKVEREAIEALLKGLDPGSGQELVSSAGSNARATARSETRAAPRQGGAVGLEVAQVAAQLQVSTRAVRHWIDAGEVAKDLLRGATPAEVPLRNIEDYQARLDELMAQGNSPEGLPPTFLLAERFNAGVRGGHRYRWAIAQHSVDRLREQRRPSDARAGWDLVFRPPKSYSVLWAVGPDTLRHDLQAIHHEATAHALSYLEDTAATARTTADVGTGRKRVRTATDGLVVAAFDHRDSRAGDPLLHTHCVVANVTRLADGSWAALDPHGLYRQGLAADAVYQASFRHLAERRLGLASEPVVNGWADVEGVPRAVVEHFSKRSEEIAAELARVGSDSPTARQIAAVASRRAKAADREADGLHERWRAEAAEVGFDAAAVSACLGRTTGAEVDEVRIEALFDRLGGADGLTEEAATFSRADVVCALATALGGAVAGPRLVSLADRFLAGERTVQVREHRPGMPRHRLLEGGGKGKGFVDDLANAAFTTPALAAIEARLMAMAADTHRWQGPVVGSQVIEATLAARPNLADEQRAMVRAVCGQPGTLRPVVGYPGSGKTYATEACVSALSAAGVPVIGCAVTAGAADELARATGLTACDTVARTLADLEHPEFGGLAPATVVIVDEASTIGHRDLDRLVSHVQAAGGALVMVGDPRQHGPVGPGHFFGWLVDREDAEVPTLRANHRQADVVDDHGEVVVSLAAEREANVAFREGRIAESLAQRDDAGLVTRAATAPELYDIVVGEWLADWQTGARDPMVTTRNAVRHDLNRRARRLLVEAGAVAGPALDVAGWRFQVGDYVVARANNRRLRSAEDPTWWLKNGSRGRVVAVDTEAFHLSVEFEGTGGTAHRVTLPTSYLARGQLEWAYAVTDYGVQSRTLGRSRAVVDDTTTAAGAYVATTRGRRENRIYLVDGSVAEETDHETSHGPPPRRESSFDALAARLAAEAPKGLIHEADPSVAAGGALAARLPLGELEALLAPLAATLAAAPPDVSRRIAGAEAACDALAARHRVLADQLAADEFPVGRRGRAARRSTGALRAELDDVTRSMEALGGRLISLRAQAAHRDRYLDDHAEKVEQRDLLRDAIAGRETKVRLAAVATAPPELTTVLPEPRAGATSAERQRWRAALEQVALYLDRWGPASDFSFGEIGGAVATTGPAVPGLGARPDDQEAAQAWDQAVRAIAETASPEHLPAQLAPEPDLSPAV
ncbi:MAG TPA: MobF family relaxase [Acidimicrobiales bacterium]|nr:MobF family relaxase [Acidimicrobiales bacterium]